MVTEIRNVGIYRVERYRIIGTPVFVHRVFAPVEDPIGGPFRTISSEEINGKTAWFGDIATRELPDHLAKMPRGDERYNAVRAWHKAQYEQAYRLIELAFPGTRDRGRPERGSIETVEPETVKAEKARA